MFFLGVHSNKMACTAVEKMNRSEKKKIRKLLRSCNKYAIKQKKKNSGRIKKNKTLCLPEIVESNV